MHDKTTAAATAAATAANKVMEKAKKSMDMSTKHVESMHDMSTKAKKEVEDAQKFLAEVEKRHEVIEITDDDDTVLSNEDGGNKKRKVSLSPQISSNVGSRDTTSNNNNNSSSSTRGVEQLVVEGCGLSAVNGTYKRRPGLCNNFPVYTKATNWNGIQTNFLIFAWTNQFGNQTWAIGTTMGTSNIYFYSTIQAVTATAPSENSIWMAEYPYGVAPSPQVKRG